MGTFDKYVYELPRRESRCGDKYASPSAHFLGTESLPDANLTMGFTVIQQETLESFPHFHHSIEEYLMFSGPDLCNFFDFDAEIELWLGEDPDEMEKYTITKPCIIRIPARLWHSPINYKRVGKPVAFSSVYFSGEYSRITRRIYPDDTVDYPYIATKQEHCRIDEPLPEKYGFALEWAKQVAAAPAAAHSGKYDKLFFEYPKEYHNYGDMYANPRGKFRGLEQMPDAHFYGGFSVVLRDSVVEVPHIHHANDEYLWFLGSDLRNPFDFDAEIEISLGWDADHQEVVKIDKPCVVRVPADMWHCPIVYKSVRKPVAFFPTYYDGDWSKILRKGDGYVYEAASLRKCSYDHDKTCFYCGKCLKDPSVPSLGVFTYKKK